MKKTIGLCFSVVLAASSLASTVQAYERVELDHDRTSVEYSGPIKSVAKVIEGYKWLGQTKEMNRPWFPRHSPSSGNSVSHTLLETAA